MSTITSRMLLLACMTFFLVLFSGCGPKPIDPYQAKTGGNKPEAKQDSSFYDYDYATESNVDSLPIAESTPLVETGENIAIGEGNIETGENIDAFLDSLPEDMGQDRVQDPGPVIAGPAVEPLNAGSGLGETLPAFNQEHSRDYKKKNGRSSPQMKSIYYDFDQSGIRDDQIPKMEANAQYMKSKPSGKVVVEGNCDERGTNEYNLALGERRAMAAKKYLLKLGIQSSRVRTMSYGEERPLFLGSEESDYALNRRTDFTLE